MGVYISYAIACVEQPWKKEVVVFAEKYLQIAMNDINKIDNPDLIFLLTQAFEPEIRKSFREMGLTSEIISINELIQKNNKR